MEHYYHVLGIPLTATIEDVKRAYRQRAKMFHPDVSSLPDARERFIEANEAYEYLIQKMNYETFLRRRNIVKPEETAQTVVDEWLKKEQERIRRKAAEYASMKYRNFKNTEAYKATRLMGHVLLYIIMGFGMLVIAGTVLGTWHEYSYHPDRIGSSYITAVILAFIVGTTITFFSLYNIVYRKD